MCAPGLGFRRFRDLGLAPTPKTKKTGETRVFKPGESHGFKTCVLCVLKPGESHGLKTGDTHNFVTCLLVYLFCVFFVRDFCCFLGVFVLVAKVHHYLHKTYTHTHTHTQTGSTLKIYLSHSHVPGVSGALVAAGTPSSSSSEVEHKDQMTGSE